MDACCQISLSRTFKRCGVCKKWLDPNHNLHMRQISRGRSRGTLAQGSYLESSGYIRLTMQYDHPLVDVNGTILEHRKVLYDTIGDGPHPCHWCSIDLEWGGLEGICVDHLDEDRQNNDHTNLVPSCLTCNWHRKRRMINAS